MRTRSRVLSFLVAVTLFGSGRVALPAETWPADAPPVAEHVRQLMQDRKYAEAVKAIDQASRTKDAPKDYLAYLKGRALWLADRRSEAAAALDAMQKEFPHSPWLRHARFAKAVMLARKGDFRAAELIVRAEAEYLLSADRKAQIAGVYIEFADALMKPPKDGEKPDYGKVLQFYVKALEVGPTAAQRIELEMLVAQCRQNLQLWTEAAELYQQFIRRHPGQRVEIEARFRLGECRLAAEMRAERGGHGKTCWRPTPTRGPRVAEAQFQLARTWNIPQPATDEQLNLGVAALRTFVSRFPAHKLASVAYLDMAESCIYRGRHEDAAATLRRFVADPRYRDCAEIPAARGRWAAATSYRKVSRGDRRLARLPGEAPGPQRVERRPAHRDRHRVSDGRGEAGGQAIRRREQAVCRVHGQVPARQPGSRYPAGDEPQGHGRRAMAGGDCRLAADRLEVSRLDRGLAGPVLDR